MTESVDSLNHYSARVHQECDNRNWWLTARQIRPILALGGS